mmetsp:Transcript_25896/g.72247  ORF Transcript_25896/g.72247 Transcript_25896/m.72247 type:complete len:364 (+) Transcript_25896:514-1605(+)
MPRRSCGNASRHGRGGILLWTAPPGIGPHRRPSSAGLGADLYSVRSACRICRRGMTPPGAKTRRKTLRRGELLVWLSRMHMSPRLARAHAGPQWTAPARARTRAAAARAAPLERRCRSARLRRGWGIAQQRCAPVRPPPRLQPRPAPGPHRPRARRRAVGRRRHHGEARAAGGSCEACLAASRAHSRQLQGCRLDRRRCWRRQALRAALSTRKSQVRPGAGARPGMIAAAHQQRQRQADPVQESHPPRTAGDVAANNRTRLLASEAVSPRNRRACYQERRIAATAQRPSSRVRPWRGRLPAQGLEFRRQPPKVAATTRRFGLRKRRRRVCSRRGGSVARKSSTTYASSSKRTCASLASTSILA